MTSNIIVCATVYQLIVALQVKRTILSNTKTDVILLDTIKNSQVLALYIAKENIFDSVFALSLNDMGSAGFIKGKMISKLKKVMSKNGVEFFLNKNYDEFFFDF